MVLQLTCCSGPVCSGGQYLVAFGEDSELDNTEEEDGKLLSISGKRFNLGSGNTFSQERQNLLLMKMMMKKMVMRYVIMIRKLKKDLQ